jgi:hypothetical protein
MSYIDDYNDSLMRKQLEIGTSKVQSVHDTAHGNHLARLLVSAETNNLPTVMIAGLLNAAIAAGSVAASRGAKRGS